MFLFPVTIATRGLCSLSERPDPIPRSQQPHLTMAWHLEARLKPSTLQLYPALGISGRRGHRESDNGIIWMRSASARDRLRIWSRANPGGASRKHCVSGPEADWMPGGSVTGVGARRPRNTLPCVCHNSDTIGRRHTCGTPCQAFQEAALSAAPDPAGPRTTPALPLAFILLPCSPSCKYWLQKLQRRPTQPLKFFFIFFSMRPSQVDENRVPWQAGRLIPILLYTTATATDAAVWALFLK